MDFIVGDLFDHAVVTCCLSHNRSERRKLAREEVAREFVNGVKKLLLRVSVAGHGPASHLFSALEIDITPITKNVIEIRRRLDDFSYDRRTQGLHCLRGERLYNRKTGGNDVWTLSS